MNEIGINGKNLDLFRHWLTLRCQRVKNEDSLSDWNPVTIRIPQGSVLWLLIFILYIWIVES